MAVIVVELVDHHGGDRLRGGEEVERRPRRDQLLLAVRRIARRVPARVADRPVQYDMAVASDADLEPRVDPRAIHRLDALPETLDRLRRYVGGVGVLVFAHRAHVFEARGDAAALQARNRGLADEIEGVHVTVRSLAGSHRKISPGP
jgi:hypothetical protein